MATIINNLDYTFSPIEQNEIQKGAAHAGVDEVYTAKTGGQHHVDGGDITLFDFYADEDFTNYLFSIDTNAGSPVIWEKR